MTDIDPRRFFPESVVNESWETQIVSLIGVAESGQAPSWTCQCKTSHKRDSAIKEFKQLPVTNKLGQAVTTLDRHSF